MMKQLDESRWKLSLAGFTAFVLATVIYLITGSNLPGILGFLTSAIVLFIINIVHIVYTNKKERGQKPV